MSVPALPQTRATSDAPANLAALLTPTSWAIEAVTAAMLIAPNEPFFLRHNPACWQVSQHLDEVVVLPEVTMHVLAPGVNGVRTRNQNDAPDMGYKASVRAAIDKGWIYLDPLAPIPQHCLPEGVPAGGYARELKVSHPLTDVPGVRYVEAWTVPVATLPDSVQAFQWDVASYERWLSYLVISGQVGPMLPSVLTTMTARVRAHVERAQVKECSPDIRAVFVKRKQDILDRYEKAKALAPDAPTRGELDRATLRAEVDRARDEIQADYNARAAQMQADFDERINASKQATPTKPPPKPPPKPPKEK